MPAIPVQRIAIANPVRYVDSEKVTVPSPLSFSTISLKYRGNGLRFATLTLVQEVFSGSGLARHAMSSVAMLSIASVHVVRCSCSAHSPSRRVLVNGSPHPHAPPLHSLTLNFQLKTLYSLPSCPSLFSAHFQVMGFAIGKLPVRCKAHFPFQDYGADEIHFTISPYGSGLWHTALTTA